VEVLQRRRVSFGDTHLYFIQFEGEDKQSPYIAYKAPALGGTKKKLIADVMSRISFSPDGKKLVLVWAMQPSVLQPMCGRTDLES